MKTIKYLIISVALISLSSCMVHKERNVTKYNENRPYDSRWIINGYTYVHSRPPID
ncbi:MAG: hypothetical protein JWQ63_126 [Mucilaginibacter sp.]|nr:hypothetical protein [Mucilaginibacter sp.]